MKTLKAIFISLVIILFCSCSSSKLADKELLKIDGLYNSKTSDDGLNNNFVKLLNRKLIKDTLLDKPIENYKFEIKNIDQKRIQITVVDEKDKILESKIYKYKRKTESIILKNKNVKPLMIPYLVGALDITKLNLKSDQNNNLVVEIYQHRSGGVFLIPMGWGSKRMKEIYHRIR